MVAARDLAPVKTPACENGHLSSWMFQKEELLTVLYGSAKGEKQKKERLPNSSVCAMRRAHEIDELRSRRPRSREKQ